MHIINWENNKSFCLGIESKNEPLFPLFPYFPLPQQMSELKTKLFTSVQKLFLKNLIYLVRRTKTNDYICWYNLCL